MRMKPPSPKESDMANLNSNPRGGLTVDRDSLHASDGYKRQIAAMELMKESDMTEKMTLEPCPFCGASKITPVRVANVGHAVSCDGCGASSEVGPSIDSAVAKWNHRHLAQPAQAVDVGLVERLRKRATEERKIAENNVRVAELLAPELVRFKAREGHNIYATRMAIDHRDSAKRDAAFADDLEAAATALTRAIGNAQADGSNGTG